MATRRQGSEAAIKPQATVLRSWNEILVNAEKFVSVYRTWNLNILRFFFSKQI